MENRWKSVKKGGNQYFNILNAAFERTSEQVHFRIFETRLIFIPFSEELRAPWKMSIAFPVIIPACSFLFLSRFVLSDKFFCKMWILLRLGTDFPKFLLGRFRVHTTSFTDRLFLRILVRTTLMSNRCTSDRKLNWIVLSKTFCRTVPKWGNVARCGNITFT
jgi:hypothetical protein